MDEEKELQVEKCKSTQKSKEDYGNCRRPIFIDESSEVRVRKDICIP